MNIYKYGMKHRGFSPGCQPLQNLIEAQEDPTGVYFNILLYSEPLTPEALRNYELTDLQPAPDIKSILIDLFKGLQKPLLKDLDTYSRNETGKPLLILIRSYAAAAKPENDFLNYIQELKNNNSISALTEYYEIVDYLKISIGA